MKRLFIRHKSFLWMSALIFIACLRIELLSHAWEVSVPTAKQFSKEVVPLYILVRV